MIGAEPIRSPGRLLPMPPHRRRFSGYLLGAAPAARRRVQQPQRRFNLSGYARLGQTFVTGNVGVQNVAAAGAGQIGTLSPQDAVDQVLPSNHYGLSEDFVNLMVQSVQQLQIVGLDAGSCAGQPSGAVNDLQLTKTASGLALTGISTGASIAGAGAALAPVTLGISIAVVALTALFSTIFSHHAAAVAKEQSVECAAVPAANNYLNIITQAVANGTSTPQEGIQALQSLQSDFESTLSSAGVVKRGGKSCNAGCRWECSLEAIVKYLTSQYNAIPPPAPAATAPAGAPAGAPSGAVLTSSGGYVTAAPASSTNTGVLLLAAAAVIFALMVR